MKAIILRTGTRYLWPLLVLYSIFLLVEGHHRPGGGFLAGLMSAAAIGLCALAYGVRVTRQTLLTRPPGLIGMGLLAMGLSGIAGMLSGEPFLTGKWFKLPWPGDGSLDVGTPLLFDIGVYLTVVGVTVMILLTLAEKRR